MPTQADTISDQLDVFLGKVVGTLGHNLVTCLRDKTPKDTRHAASNWVATVGGRLAGPFGSRRSVSFAAQERGLERLKTYKLSHGSVNIGNDVHYVPIINATHAQAGFILRGIEEAVAKTQGEFR